MCKGLWYLEKWGIAVDYCWKYGQSKLLLHFIENRLNQLNNKHTEIEVNLIFWKPLSNKMSGKSLKFFDPRTTKWSFFAKLNRNQLLMANILKLYEYQTFALMKMCNMSKIWFSNNKFNLWKGLKRFGLQNITEY